MPPLTADRLLSVSDGSPRPRQAIGRAAAIIALVLEHQAAINGIVAGCVEFHVAPDGRILPKVSYTLEARR